MKAFLQLCFFLSLSIPAHAIEWESKINRDHPLTGKVYDLNRSEEIAPEQMLARLESASVVLIGEKHDNPDHHSLELKILRYLLRTQPKTSVVFEMLNDDQQFATTTLRPADTEGALKQKLNWNDKGWPWPYYGPLVALAASQGATILPGNISRSQMKLIYKDGQAALKADSRLNTALSISHSIRSALLDSIYSEHCEMMPKTKLTPMVDIQLARDARMASAVAASATQTQTLLIAGAFHVRKDSAVPLHLTYRSPNLKPIVILLAEVDPNILDLPAYVAAQGQIADYVWFTPVFTNRNYCDAFKASHK